MTETIKTKAQIFAERLAEQEAENARRIAAIEAEQDAYDTKIEDALSKAGRARVVFVEELLELLDVQPAPLEEKRNLRTGEVITDRKTGKPKMVDPDPDETDRMQRLLASVQERLAGPEQTEAEADDTVADIDEDDLEEAEVAPVYGMQRTA